MLDCEDTPIARYKNLLGIIKAENQAAIINHLGRGIYKLDLPLITCTGADIETIVNIPFHHELIKMETKHTDSAKADSANSLDYSISHRHHPNLWLLLLTVSASTASDIMDEYEDYYLQAGEYLLTTKSTITELLYISVYIQDMGA